MSPAEIEKQAALDFLAEIEREDDETREQRSREQDQYLRQASTEERWEFVNDVLGEEPEDEGARERVRHVRDGMDARMRARRDQLHAGARQRFSLRLVRQPDLRHPDAPAQHAPVRPRPRGRRERRVARSTSSADSGSSGEGEPGNGPARPARGLAICPLCCNEAIVRLRCALCGGLGYVARPIRNAWKRGWRP